MRVSQARERYVRGFPHTVRAYECDIAAFERHLGAKATVTQIDKAHVVAFMEAQRTAGLSSTSLRGWASGLRGFGRWLSASGLRQVHPRSGG